MGCKPTAIAAEMENIQMSNTKQLKGRIVKALSGYYYVLPAEEGPSGQTVQCRARGVFKKNGN